MKFIKIFHNKKKRTSTNWEKYNTDVYKTIKIKYDLRKYYNVSNEKSIYSITKKSSIHNINKELNTRKKVGFYFLCK